MARGVDGVGCLFILGLVWVKRELLGVCFLPGLGGGREFSIAVYLYTHTMDGVGLWDSIFLNGRMWPWDVVLQTVPVPFQI